VGDYVRAGQLQALQKEVPSLTAAMEAAVAAQDYVRAGAIQAELLATQGQVGAATVGGDGTKAGVNAAAVAGATKEASGALAASKNAERKARVREDVQRQKMAELKRQRAAAKVARP
jgi:hypothetical protein